MTMFVFLGPTLPVAEAAAVLDAEYLPPVSQGDVCRVARKASAIGIIDGYFHSVPAVWHKEILWAMSEGVPVYGAASMGALRAAELAAFGMRGVGWVFEAFARGELEDDDEVAVLHSTPRERQRYLSFSEPMVNMRRSLAAAASAGIISADTCGRLTQLSKQLYYGDRSYHRMLRDAAGLVGRDELERLAVWLPEHRIDQKREDALAMLRRMAADARDTEAVAPSQPEFRFQHTELWQRLLHRVQSESVAAATARTRQPSADPRLDEQAMLRWLLLEVARQQHIECDDAALRETVLEFRRRAQLWEPEQLSEWLDRQQLTMPEFVAIMQDEARIRGMLEWVRLEAERLRPHVQTLALA